MVVDLEQQVIPTLVVSHVSVLQLLIAYFRKSPVDKCMEIEVPLHTVIRFAPARGGGWSESQHPLSPIHASADGEYEGVQLEGLEKLESISATPIWGDHMRKPSSVSAPSKSS